MIRFLAGAAMALLFTVTTPAFAQTPAQGSPPYPRAGGGAEEIEMDIRWFQCKGDADCAVTEDVCGTPNAINKNFLSAYAATLPAMRREIQQAGGCPAQSDNVKAILKNMVPKCVQSHCGMAYNAPKAQ